MLAEKLQSNRLKIEQTHEGTLVTVRAKVNPAACGFLVIWLGGWTFAGVMLGTRFLEEQDQGGASWLIIGLTGGWAIVFLLSVSSLIWMIFGKEHLLISGVGLSKKMTPSLFPPAQKFERSQITALHLNTPEAPYGGRKQVDSPVAAHGRIAINYRGKIRTFGMGLDDSEAEEVLKLIAAKTGLRRDNLTNAV